MASQPATPTDERNTSTQSTMSVARADPKPNNILRCGRTVSSATFANPSRPRKNQTAKGTAAHTPFHPKGKACNVTFFHSKCGKQTPENNNSSKTASTVTI